MDKYVAWLPSPGQQFSEKKFLSGLSTPMRDAAGIAHAAAENKNPPRRRIIGANRHQPAAETPHSLAGFS